VRQENIKYEFGIVVKLEYYSENKYALKLFMNKKDTVGYNYFVTKNDLNI